jgi:hypothetical protein
MALKARWTPEAKETFNALIEYLEINEPTIKVRNLKHTWYILR